MSSTPDTTPRPRILAPPGVFAPRSDTWMLAEAARDRGLATGADVLDLCTGSGAIAVLAGAAGARSVTAVDVSRRAVLAARLNGLLNGVRVKGVRGDLLAAMAGRRFDLILSNPPYLPCEDPSMPERGPRRAWDAGPDGRLVLDRICAEGPGHLRPGGSMLLIHSSLCVPERTLALLREAGLHAEVVERRRGPLGPLLAARAEHLERAGLLEPGRREEELVIVQGQRPA